MTNNQHTATPASLQLNWEAVYIYFLPEIVEIYKMKYTGLRNEPPFYIPASQQPYELNTSRYGYDFWVEVFNEHLLYGGSFENTWNVFMSADGYGMTPWPDIMRRAPKVFSEMGLYEQDMQSNTRLPGAFSYTTTDATVQQVIDGVKDGEYDPTGCLAFMMSPEKWERLTDPEVYFHIANCLEQFLSIGAREELELKLGAKVKPFFDWIASAPSHAPQT